MKKVGITGQPGFIGTHLYNFLGVQTDIERIPFEDSYFDDNTRLDEFVSSCDTIVHLAAMNRHEDQQVIYNTNIELVRKLVDACDRTNSNPHILFSSSTQEDKDNLYGKSKKDGRMIFEEWARKANASFTGLVIPNVFGPFGLPNYNSVFATFCHKITHDEIPEIHVDGELKLIYVGELVKGIYNEIQSPDSSVKEIRIPHTSKIKVSELLKLLKEIHEDYTEKGMIPDISNPFVLNVFNSYLCYLNHKSIFPFKLKLNTDDRGSFVETIKARTGGQVSFSTTKPGITRGNHYHSRKAERFAVIKGKARIEFRKIGTTEIYSFDLDGSEPGFVDMPIWYTHNITNTGDEDLYTIFWINEFFDTDDPDTFFEKV